MSAKIISAFPACGKSTYYREWSQYSPENVWRRKNNGEQVLNNLGEPCGEKILDSDSSLFSWIYDENGNKTDVRNPDFPNNYIQHIKDHMETEDIIFVSSHKTVRDALRENNIKYTLIYPDREGKFEWLTRCRNRGNDESFITFIDNNWDKFITEMEEETYPEKYILKPWSSWYDAITIDVMNEIMDYREVAYPEE